MPSVAPRAQSELPPVVVAGGFHTAVVLMRSLARHGIEVHCIDFNPKQPVFSTVYGKAHVCPNADDEPSEWVKFMIGLAQKIGRRPALIATSDLYVTAMAEHADALAPCFFFHRASMAVQGLLATKKRQYEIAGNLGLTVPSTRFVRSVDETMAFAAQARFPVILKPLHFREWKFIARSHPLFEKKLIVIDTPRELEAQYRLAADINPEMVIQEMIEGPDTAKLVYLSCYTADSRRLASCMFRQVRTDPIYFGSASLVEPVSDPEADVLCDRFLQKLNYAGICEIELKRDSRDGRIKMIEANPRYSVTADAAVYAGVDLGWIHYLDLIGQQPEPVFPNGAYFRHIVLFRDIAAFRSYIREGLLTWGAFFRSYTGPVHFFDFDPKDPRVARQTVLLALKLLVSPFARRILRRPSRP